MRNMLFVLAQKEQNLPTFSTSRLIARELGVKFLILLVGKVYI